jgi:NAD(P)-dependent dehydrogenase (short-subunit alcohol dehydrogenase family)
MHSNPIIIVTGASRGMGAAIAQWLGKSGTGVALMARTKTKLDGVADAVHRVGGEAMVVAGDVRQPGVCRRAIQKTIDRFGRLDALINNAATVEPLAYTAQADPDAWRRAMEVNLLGPFSMCRYAIHHLREQKGRIVNISSGAANTALVAAGAYCAAKAALNHFTRILAAEEPAITSVAIRPGVVDTQMQTELRETGPKVMPHTQAAFYLDLKKQGRLEPPLVPARSIAWLALHAPGSFSGQFLNYDDPEIAGPALKAFGETL